MLLNIIYLLAGFIILVYGANLLVDGGAALAHRLKVPNIVIGLTVVAFGTSTCSEYHFIDRRKFRAGIR